jgi:hypothetical protein
MDVKNSFSSDSIVTIQAIGREWAMPGRHGPPFVKRFKGPYRDHEGRKPPDRHEHPPSEERSDGPPKEAAPGEGFEITI